nr:MAG TPA: tail completion protein [Caudoviricetes sp.]
MQNPLTDILFSPDPVEKLYRDLRQALPDELPLYRDSLPEKWNADKGAAVVVADGAPQGGDTAHDRDLVRVTVHAPTRDLARNLGRAIADYLFSPVGGLGLAIIRTRSTRPIVGPDSLRGGYVSTASYSCGQSRRSINNA